MSNIASTANATLALSAIIIGKNDRIEMYNNLDTDLKINLLDQNKSLEELKHDKHE